MIVLGACCRFQTVDFISHPENTKKSNNKCFFIIDDLSRRNNGFVFGLLAKKFDQENIVGATARNQDLSFWKLVNGD